MSKKLIVAAEASAMHLKEHTVKFLEQEGYDFTDATGDGLMTYIEAGSVIGKAISSGEYDLGIVMCGSGMGVNLVANRYPGVFCGLVENVNTAAMARSVTNCNVLALGGNIVAYDLASKMIKAFVETEFSQAENLRRFYEEMVQVDKETHGLA